MNKLSRVLCCTSLAVLVPFVANAAGTYYNGTYKSPQLARYNTNAGAASRTTGASQYGQTRYNYSSYVNQPTRAAATQRRTTTTTTTRTTTKKQQSATSNLAQSGGDQGFWLGAGL